MNEAEVLTIGKQAMTVALEVSLPVLLFGLVAGLIVSVFQAVTQIQEMTLSFVPKILAVAVAMLMFGSWMISRMVGFMLDSFTRIPLGR